VNRPSDGRLASATAFYSRNREGRRTAVVAKNPCKQTVFCPRPMCALFNTSAMLVALVHRGGRRGRIAFGPASRRMLDLERESHLAVRMAYR
jgi:hypothetical protein